MDDVGKRIRSLLDDRILILDGAMGTSIQAHDLDESAYRGDAFGGHPVDLKGCNDLLTITRPELAASYRPGIRFGLIDQALDPVTGIFGLPAKRLAQLKNDLAAVISADALFPLTDLCRLSPDEAVSSLVRTATTITAVAASGDSSGPSPSPSAPRQ